MPALSAVPLRGFQVAISMVRASLFCGETLKRMTGAEGQLRFPRFILRRAILPAPGHCAPISAFLEPLRSPRLSRPQSPSAAASCPPPARHRPDSTVTTMMFRRICLPPRGVGAAGHYSEGRAFS